MIRDIVRWGDPRLCAANGPVPPEFEALAPLVTDLYETCHAAPGVGLAAPQIGVNLRVAVIDLSIGAEPGAKLTLINPEILEWTGEQKEEEGCLSIPDIAAKVIRPARVRARFRDAAGCEQEVEGTGLLARALCHEIDHLSGVLYVDRLRGLKRELTWRKIERSQGRRSG